MEELIFGRGFSNRREICVTNSIGLACSWEANKKRLCHCAVFTLFYFVFEGNFPLYLRAIYKSRGLKFGGEI